MFDDDEVVDVGGMVDGWEWMEEEWMSDDEENDEEIYNLPDLD